MGRASTSLVVGGLSTVLVLLGAERLYAQANVDGQWTGVLSWGATPNSAIEAVHVALLPTGKVMFWSTWATSSGLWDPVTATFSAPEQPSYNTFCSGAVFLPDGRLFIAGGHIQNYNGEPRADIYNPFTNKWASKDATVPDVPNMGNGSSNVAQENNSGKRWYPGAVELGNGDILVTSGDVVTQGVTNRTSQVYQLATNSWRNLTNAIRPSNDRLPEYPRLFLAPDGRAIDMSDNSNETEFLDTAGTGAWSMVGPTLDSNLHNYGPAVMYDTGKIAYLGGGNTPSNHVNLLDLNVPNPQWEYGLENMAQGRRHNNATIMADGNVLITGGTSTVGWNDPTNLVAAAEIWNPDTQEMTQVAAANPTIYRGYHSTATLLPDGRVLVTGGDHNGPGGNGTAVSNNNAEIYSPPYLFKGARPTVTAAPDVVEMGDTIYLETPDAADITKALWIAPGSTTHAQNWTQRCNILDFEVTDGGLNVDLPANTNEAPPGYYMLFLVNSAGVPSMAEWVRATTVSPNTLNADFNGDLTVDGADLLTLQKNLGGPANKFLADGDANDDGVVDGDDYNIWASQILVSPTLAAASAAIPEPATAVLATVFGLSCARRRRRA